MNEKEIKKDPAVKLLELYFYLTKQTKDVTFENLMDKYLSEESKEIQEASIERKLNRHLKHLDNCKYLSCKIDTDNVIRLTKIKD